MKRDALKGSALAIITFAIIVEEVGEEGDVGGYTIDGEVVDAMGEAKYVES